MIQTQIRTDALKRLLGILEATVQDCATATEENKDDPLKSDVHRRLMQAQRGYFNGKRDGLESAISLLHTLGPQVETEAYENGYKRGGE